jgi:hypothetical protein
MQVSLLWSRASNYSLKHRKRDHIYRPAEESGNTDAAENNLTPLLRRLGTPGT